MDKHGQERDAEAMPWNAQAERVNLTV